MHVILYCVIGYVVLLALFQLYHRCISHLGRVNFSNKTPKAIITPWYFPWTGPILSVFNVESFFKQCRKKYGEVFSLLFFGKWVTFICDVPPEDRKIFFTTSNLGMNEAAELLFGDVYPGAKFLSEGGTIEHMHQIFSPTQLTNVAKNLSIVLHDVLNPTDGIIWRGKDSIVIDVFDFVYDLTIRLNVLNFSSPRLYKECIEEVVELYSILDFEKNKMRHIFDGLIKKIGFGTQKDKAWKRWVEQLSPDIYRKLHLIENCIPEDDQNTSGVDAIYKCVEACKKKLDRKSKPFDPEFVAFIIFSTFFPAQLNTYTASALLILEYIKHSQDDIGLKMKKEFDDNPNLSELTVHDLNRMDYTEACIHEVIRRSTFSQLFFRLCTKNLSLSNGIVIPAGNITICPSTTARDLYKEPDLFDPERHLEPRQENKGDIYRAVPFGRGKHACSGERYGKMQIKVLMTALHRMCNVEFADEQSKNYEAKMNRNMLAGLSRPTIPVNIRLSKKQYYN
ncbi:cytochrome P450 [Acrasis kona]|uniref:Cytochrome P450 n=1 Tax=Acrasis kona TaxID=1008807 RepID=A0AAW2Z9J0_9EUKA